MPKKAISVTLEEGNLIWLKGRARVIAGGSLSEALDQLIVEARAGRLGAADPPRSVVGTIDIPDDAVLLKAAKDITSLFTGSLDRAIFAQEAPASYRATRKSRKSKK